jgi:3-mercaptopyruvate sulfurtransferase SseA
MENGVAKVAALKGGWAAWQRAGYPIEGQQAAAPAATATVDPAGEKVAVLGNPGAPVTIVEFSDYQ